VKPLDVLLILVCLMFATGLIVDRRWGPEREQHERVVRLQQQQLDVIQKRLLEFNDKTGRFPTNEEGLEIVPHLRGALMSGRFTEARAFLETSDGIRCIYGIPFVYENRQGRPAEAFELSPANHDAARKRRWSRVVAPDVVVSSLGLRKDVNRVFGHQWLDALLYFGGGAIVFLSIAYIVARNRGSVDRVRGINAMVVVGVAALLALIVGISSGGEIAQRIGGGSFGAPVGMRRGDLLSEYLAVLQSFADRGGFDPAAREQLEATLRAEFARDPDVVWDAPTVEAPPPARSDG
jgi:hypothetical protein